MILHGSYPPEMMVVEAMVLMTLMLACGGFHICLIRQTREAHYSVSFGNGMLMWWPERFIVAGGLK